MAGQKHLPMRIVRLPLVFVFQRNLRCCSPEKGRQPSVFKLWKDKSTTNKPGSGLSAGSPQCTMRVRNLQDSRLEPLHVEALITRIGFGGPLCHNYDKEPPKNSRGTYLGPATPRNRPTAQLAVATGRPPCRIRPYGNSEQTMQTSV